MQGNNVRKTATIVGLLFIIATVTSLISVAFLGSALDGTNFLVGITEYENNVISAAMVELILAISLVAIGSLMFPILKKYDEGLALGYSSVRLIEAVLIIIATISLMLMLSIGKDLSAGTMHAADPQSLGALTMDLREWSFLLGTLIFLGIGALILNYVLYRSRLVPRWLSIWGLIGGVGVIVYGILGFFGTDTNAMDATTLLALPIAVQEMAFAVWLIVKGFNTATVGEAA